MSHKRTEIPIDVLHEILEYDEYTGKLFWKERNLHSEWWSVERAKQFNQKYAGKEAGSPRYPAKNKDYVRLELRLPDGKIYLAHRVAWALKKDEWPDGMIDHEDQNPLNNKWDNLRLVDNATNQQNAVLRADNKVGISGVCWVESKRKWQVSSQANGKRVYSSHASLLDAVAERFRQLKEMGFSKNHGRKRHDSR